MVGKPDDSIGLLKSRNLKKDPKTMLTKGTSKNEVRVLGGKGVKDFVTTVLGPLQ